jgi:flagellar basal body-associated protein FliL
MNLVGDKDSETAKELAEAQRKLQSAIAITTGLQALQNALQKESALMMGINKLRMLAAAAAQRAYAAATRDAEAAQAVFNKVAKSNIYVWLASVILTVVGAIAAFTRGSKEQKEETRKVNEELKTQLEYLRQLDEMYSALGEKAIKDAQYQLDRAKASGKSTEEIRKYEDELFNARLANLEKLEEELGYSRKEHNRLQWEYEHQLQEYEDGVRRMAENAGKVPDIVTQISQAALDEQKKHLDETKGILDEFEKLYDERKNLQNEQAEREAQRRREDEEASKRAAEQAAKRWRENAQAIRDANKALIEVSTADQLYKKSEEANQKLAQSFQDVADRVGLFADELKDLPAPKDIPFISDAGLTDSTSQLELFAESYKENAQAIQETSSALESSFSSLSSMYQQMAQDESKTEEEREKAARKAKAWASIQVAANAGAAIAKGVASAVDVGFPAAIPAMATMTATILAAIAQAKSLLAEAHEHGGVIGGKFVGATRGGDDVAMTGRRGELVLDADQQKRLYDIANGSASSNLTASLVEALQAMPAPVLIYSEFQRFTDRVATLDDAAKLQ